jgi:UPF0755 protein
MRWRLLAGVAGMVAILAVAGIGATRFATHRFLQPGPLAEPRAFVVPRGTPAALGDALHDAGIIADPRSFLLASWWTANEGPLRAGELAFPAGASLRQVLTILRIGRPVQHRLTIPEGLTAAQIALLVDAAELLEGDTPVPDEGSVMPQTYSYERATPRAALVDRAVRAMARAVAEAWAGRSADLPLSGPAELLTLASIIERETARPEERRLVAAVFVNRLRRGMRLQSDPTVAYAATGGLGGLDRSLTRVDLDSASPYNTYRITGLPPGPIASPGLASLAAAAHPADTEDLYFVADGAGGHVFARTLDEHNRNVARWRAQTQAPPTGSN